MNPLTEMMIEQRTRWALPENKGDIIRDLMRSVEHGGDVVRIEDTLYPHGNKDKYGNTVDVRRFYFEDGGFVRINPFRGHVYLEPLPKNPLTLEDVEGEYRPLG